MLRCNGGKGVTEDGDIVYRILGGDILPVGAGVVSKPASGLKGILAIPEHRLNERIEYVAATDPNNRGETKDESAIAIMKDGKVLDSVRTTDLTTSEIAARLDEINEIFNVSSTNLAKAIERVGASASDAGVSMQDLSIKLQETSVNNNTTTLIPMKIKSFDELAQQWTEVKKLETAASVITDLKEVAEASARVLIEEAIAAKSVEFSKQLEEQKTLAKQISDAKELADAANKELADTVKTLQGELQTIRAAQIAQANEDKFNTRMELLDAEFELDDEDRGFIVKEVQALETDEAFANYMTKQKKLMAGKKKKEKAPPFVAASAGVNAQEAVASVKEVAGQSVANTTDTSANLTLADKVRAIMTETITVGNEKVVDQRKSTK